ncbi:MAG: site-2 protease family protein, partial [Bdellovibrionales bacterium]|nr:site-2 protease family protein [Bdellovibrionales bacterium]
MARISVIRLGQSSIVVSLPWFDATLKSQYLSDLEIFLSLTFLVIFPALLIAVILHEIAHGLAAEKLGDPTARALGRITLNPISHIDPFMTLILPGVLILSGSPIVFGGAKPVPVNPNYFVNPRRGMLWVALAGPITNFILATAHYLLLLGLYGLVGGESAGMGIQIIELFLGYSVLINLVLGIFNLIPIPPLDGGRILVGILPIRLARPVARLERYGLLILVLLLFSGVIDSFLSPIFSFILEHLFQISPEMA